MNRSMWMRAVAGLLSVVLTSGSWLFAAPAPASIHGTVTLRGGTQPIEGAVILLGNPRDGSVVPSAPADAQGRFALPEVAPDTYRMAVRQGDRLWVVDAPITLAPGQSRDVTLGIDPQQAQSPDAAAKDDDKDKMGFWNNPLMASLIVVGSAIVVGLLIDSATDDDDPTPASPSAQTN